MEQHTKSQELETIIVEPSRLQSGLWGYEEGDINKSYSADVYGEKKTIRQPFIHASRPYVAMSIHGNSKLSEARAYPLVHESYRESILEDLAKTGHELSYSYVGKPVSYRKQKCVLGLQVIFKQRAYTDEEHIDLLRRMYGYGGLFAAEAGSYTNFLSGELEQADQTHISAISNELDYAKDHRLKSQADLRSLIALNFQNSAAEKQLSMF